MQEILKKSLLMYREQPRRINRIPGMVVSARGTILVYFEMRGGVSDWSCDAIGCMRSTDQGESWSALRVIATAPPGIPLNNPVMIACRDGRIVCLWQQAYARGYRMVSLDDGESFSPANEFTRDVEAFRGKTGYAWDVFALGPGHGIELADGRLLVPVWYANGGERSHSPSVMSTLTSRDGGESWITGALIGDDEILTNPNETCAFQRDDGAVTLNIRHMGKAHYRAVATSPDGVDHFSAPALDLALPDPICFGSIAKASFTIGGSAPVVFSNCANHPCRDNHFSRRRERLTLSLSLDDGATWQHRRLLENYGGYSDVAFSPDGQWVYCFYEHDTASGAMPTQPRYLTFARMNFPWLTDTLQQGGDAS